ncbi:MAG TPA: VPLPA-CTERM sorting domain-containing protein [Pseudomonadales bacterium]|nr:VPLPA-CTERM sorting domain-containing protein [Pseudomonadales bacterium]
MNQMMKPLKLASVLAAGLLSVNVHAAAVSATASIMDLSGTLLNFSNDQFLSDASIPSQSGFDASTVLQSYYYTASDANGNYSYAEIDNTLAPLPQTHAGALRNGKGSATVLWTFDWTATGTGVASVDLQYLYSATVSNLLSGETGIASSSISAVLDGTSNKQDVLYYFNNQNGNTSGIADLILNFNVVAGQTGTISVVTASNAVSAVPVPAAVWLLGSGLLGLGGLAKRRQS